jgi:hypothetical protein
MKEFFKKMVSASGDVSHKRVIVVFFAICIVIFCFIAIYTSKVIPEFMFDALCLVVGGGMGLSVLDKVKSLKPKDAVVEQPQPQPQPQPQDIQTEESVSEM